MADRYHRIRFYQGQWSNFDQIVPCHWPKLCLDCSLGVSPLCDEDGHVPPRERAATATGATEEDGRE